MSLRGAIICDVDGCPAWIAIFPLAGDELWSAVIRLGWSLWSGGFWSCPTHAGICPTIAA